VVKKSLN